MKKSTAWTLFVVNFLVLSNWICLSKDLQCASLYGIGIAVDWDGKLPGLAIVDALPKSPAETAGLRSRDIIIEINGAKLSEFTGNHLAKTNQAANLIKGPQNSQVELLVHRNELSEPIQFHVQRSSPLVFDEGSLPYFSREMLTKKIGRIEMEEIRSTSDSDILDIIPIMLTSGMEKLILDLRRCYGGSLEGAVRLANLFMTKNIKQNDEMGSAQANNDSSWLKNIQLVVLIGKETKGVTVATVGILKESGRATVVGDNTSPATLSNNKRTLPAGISNANLEVKSASDVAKPVITERDWKNFQLSNSSEYEGEIVEPDIIVEDLSSEELAKIRRSNTDSLSRIERLLQRDIVLKAGIEKMEKRSNG